MFKFDLIFCVFCDEVDVNIITNVYNYNWNGYLFQLMYFINILFNQFVYGWVVLLFILFGYYEKQCTRYSQAYGFLKLDFFP